MDQNPKIIILISFLVVVLFAGGLTYIYRQSQNRDLALNLVRQYINTQDIRTKQNLALEIQTLIQPKTWAMTSRASFDSFDLLVANAMACEGYAAKAAFSPRGDATQEDAWRYCMDHPEVLTQK